MTTNRCGCIRHAVVETHVRQAPTRFGGEAGAAAMSRGTAGRLRVVVSPRSEGDAAASFGIFASDEIWLWPASPGYQSEIRIWADWRDRAPLQDGLPALHFRLQAKKRGEELSQDIRAETADHAAAAIFAVFGWSRPER
jgi:hypothetical protein